MEPFSSQYGSSVINFAINSSVEGTLNILDSKNKLTSIQLSVISANKTKSEDKTTSRSKFEISLEQNLNKLRSQDLVQVGFGLSQKRMEV